MPLQGGSSSSAIHENIRRLVAEGYGHKQSMAIAYSKAGKSRKQRSKKANPGIIKEIESRKR